MTETFTQGYSVTMVIRPEPVRYDQLAEGLGWFALALRRNGVRVTGPGPQIRRLVGRPGTAVEFSWRVGTEAEAEALWRHFREYLPALGWDLGQIEAEVWLEVRLRESPALRGCPDCGGGGKCSDCGGLAVDELGEPCGTCEPDSGHGTAGVCPACDGDGVL